MTEPTTWTVIFTAPWHDHEAGYFAVVEAVDENEAVIRAIYEDLVNSQVPQPDDINDAISVIKHEITPTDVRMICTILVTPTTVQHFEPETWASKLS
jgi:hypothetical protein